MKKSNALLVLVYLQKELPIDDLKLELSECENAYRCLMDNKLIINESGKYITTMLGVQKCTELYELMPS